MCSTDLVPYPPLLSPAALLYLHNNIMVVMPRTSHEAVLGTSGYVGDLKYRGTKSIGVFGGTSNLPTCHVIWLLWTHHLQVVKYSVQVWKKGGENPDLLDWNFCCHLNSRNLSLYCLVHFSSYLFWMKIKTWILVNQMKNNLIWYFHNSYSRCNFDVSGIMI